MRDSPRGFSQPVQLADQRTAFVRTSSFERISWNSNLVFRTGEREKRFYIYKEVYFLSTPYAAFRMRTGSIDSGRYWEDASAALSVIIIIITLEWPDLVKFVPRFGRICIESGDKIPKLLHLLKPRNVFSFTVSVDRFKLKSKHKVAMAKFQIFF